ncbi:hypothetical protein C0J50_21444, partial [Silurus asotus]
QFRYLGSTVQSNEKCVREVKKRVQAGWSGWRRVIAGVICDRRVFVSVKGKVYRTMVRLEKETGALSKMQEVKLEVAELKMLICLLGMIRMDKGQRMRERLNVGHFKDKVREVRLRWFGHVQRRDMGYINIRKLRMEPTERRQRGSPRKRFMDVVREDMQ